MLAADVRAVRQVEPVVHQHDERIVRGELRWIDDHHRRVTGPREPRRRRRRRDRAYHAP
jgi:hypothetical protein